MKKLFAYIALMLLFITQTTHAQELALGKYAKSQAGLQLKLKINAQGAGILVILSTQDEEEPAWVPDKRKECEMILTDASKQTACKLIQAPEPETLRFKQKDPNNISTVSLQYTIDTEACAGSHTLVINYAVSCKKGENNSGQIKIPFSIVEKEEKTEPVATTPPLVQAKKEDSARQATIASLPKPQQTEDNPRERDRNDPAKPIIPSENGSQTSDRENTGEAQNPSTTTTNSQNRGSSPIENKDIPPISPQPVEGEKTSSFPWVLLLLLPILAGLGWFLFGRKKKKAATPLPATQAQSRPMAAPTISATKAQPLALKAVPRPFKDGKYTVLPLHKCWRDSSIHQLFLNMHMMHEIDRFITDQNIRPFKEEGSDAVPEIGGFILGQYKKGQNEGEWDIFLEKFVPITPGKSGVYRVSFETMAWAELAEVQDKYPALQTLAWFHTHPGHGLFLSQPDLRIHNGFFKEKYQLAMVIDSLSEGLDTAFFTRKKTGEMNNRNDRATAQWFKWEQLMKLQMAHE